MAAGATYTSIASNTLSSAASSVSFTSISGAYTDLVLIINSGSSAYGTDWTCRVNGDSSALYSRTVLAGTGSVANSSSVSGGTYTRLNGSGFNDTPTNTTVGITHFMNYSNATNYKTILSRSGNAANGVSVVVSLWRSTAAITSIEVFTNDVSTYNSGATFSLYGIAAA
jgi:hypothetical protein